jgi:CubicO group peptidase (beta-lactamase class C family)
MIPHAIASRLETLVRTAPAAEVTTRAAEAPPREAGLEPGVIEAIWDAVEGLYGSGLHPAIALCLRVGGLVVIDRAIGHAAGNAPDDPPDAPKTLATPATLFNIFSASKAVTAMLAHLLDERRLVHLDDPVDDYIPGFGRNGKEWITLRHVLTHRAGIPTVAGARVDLDLLSQPDRIIELLSEARPVWRPGRRIAYHALTGGFVIGEVVRRVTGIDVRTFLRREILDPLGFETMCYGVAPADVARVARNAFTGPPVVYPFSALLERALGVDFVRACSLSNDPRFLTAVVPAGNVIGTANEVSRFFELLLRGGTLDGVRVFDWRTVRRAVAEQSWLEMDLTLGMPVRYGMGFVLGGDYVSLYGPRTPHAFGHLGFTNVIAWADPERDVSGCLMTSGKPFATPRLRHVYEIMRRTAKLLPRQPGRRIGPPERARPRATAHTPY